MKNVLFIYRGLQVGGIETFYCRLAEKYYRDKFNFRFLFLCEREDCNPELLARLERSAQVNFYSEYVLAPLVSWAKKFPIPVKLFCKVSPAASSELINSIDVVHATEGLGILLAHQLFTKNNKVIKINVGFYHQKEFSWGRGKNLPYFETINRKALRALDSKNIAFFNEGVAETVCMETGHDIDQVNVFPLGIDISDTVVKKNFSAGKKIKIISIGRLTNFKTYNLWMIDVVSELVRKGYDVTYDIYGHGDIEGQVAEKVKKADVPVNLKGTLQYSEFSNVVVEYDLFVGSGTAIIEASALGVPAVIGIESIAEPLTYGYFSRIPGFTYNEQGLDFPLYTVTDLVEEFTQSPLDEKSALSIEHFAKAKMFSMEKCVDNFSILCECSISELSNTEFYSWFWYRTNYLMTSILSKIFKTSYAEKYN